MVICAYWQSRMYMMIEFALLFTRIATTSWFYLTGLFIAFLYTK